MSQPAKARVRQSFERAAASYDSAAAIQRGICDDLLAGLPDMLPGCVLDAGCGTGYALPALARRFPGAKLLGLDLSTAMLARVAAPCERLAGDLEHLPLAAASIDLYWSSLAVQWCELPAVLHEARRCLAPGGRMALATLGPGTFRELRHAFAGIDTHRHTLAFHDAETVAALADAAGLSAVDASRQERTAFYADFKSLLRAVKAVGANQLGAGRRTALLGRTAFARAEAAYGELRTPSGLPLTYEVITLYAQR